jgi:hypothetical protein
MPAKMLENETMVQGFGEGTEDAKNLARFIDGIREWMNPLYQFFDEIVMRRAWNEDFFRIIQQDYPEYEGMSYTDAFYRWKNSFKVEWPSLLRDPDSETKAEEVRQKALIAMMEVLLPHMDPDNRVRVIEWAIDNAGENRILFPQPLVLDSEALRDYEPPVETMGDAPTPPRPFSSAV